MYGYGSRQISSVAIEMAITKTREEEIEKKAVFAEQGIKTAAVDCGGEFISSVKKFVERAVVAAKREGVIKETHSEEGAVAGATREALSQISLKAVLPVVWHRNFPLLSLRARLRPSSRYPILSFICSRTLR